MKSKQAIKEKLIESIASQKQHHKNLELMEELQCNMSIVILSWVLEIPVKQKDNTFAVYLNDFMQRKNKPED